MTIATWFVRKNYTANEAYAISVTEPAIERETEKAYLLSFKTEWGIIKGWFPKSVCNIETAVEVEQLATVEVKEGDVINHKSYGKGVVLSVDDIIVSVKFECGKKQLAKSYLSKVVA